MLTDSTLLAQDPRSKMGTPLRTLAEAQDAPKPRPQTEPRTKKEKGLIAFLQKHRPELGLRMVKVAGRSFFAGSGHTAVIDGSDAEGEVVLGQQRQDSMNMLGMVGQGRGWEAPTAGGGGSDSDSDSGGVPPPLGTDEGY